MKFQARVKVIASGGKLSADADGISVTNANSALLLIAAATSYKSFKDVSGDPDALARKYLSQAGKLVLERLVEKGKIMVKRAYADWNRYAEYKRPFHEHAIELIDVPQSRYSGKNSADIRMVVDAMDLAYAKQHVDSFALVSGDSDFSPLVSKLRENDRYVIGLGVKSSSSELLVGNCDEFIFYEDLIRESKKTTSLRGLPEKKAEAFAQLIEAIQALQRENKDTLWGSMVKQTMIRKNPAFNESYYGYSTFSKLLEEAAKQKILTLERDAKSGTYIITSIEGDRAA